MHACSVCGGMVYVIREAAMQSNALNGEAVSTPHLDFEYELSQQQTLSNLREDGSSWERLLPGIDYSTPSTMDDRWAALPEPQSRLCRREDYGDAGRSAAPDAVDKRGSL